MVPMKTAILISGHMRTFEKCLPTMHWHVFRHFPNADFFVSTIADADAPKADLLRVKYPNARVEIEAVAEQPDCVAEMRAKGLNLPVEWQQGRIYTHEPYAISVHPQAVLRQLWQLQRCWELFTSKATTDYNLVIRCRPDLWFHSFRRPFVLGDPSAYTPWFGEFGGVNDRFAILSAGAARPYFTAYLSIPQLLSDGCPLHPESLISAVLESAGVCRRPLATEFSTLRSNGEMRRWDNEVSPADMARMRV
jgi:hypothetical protein